MRAQGVLSVVLLCSVALLPAQEIEPQVSLPEPSFHFEILGKSTPVEHTFAFQNNTTETLEAVALKVTPPLAVPSLTKRVLPGQLGILHFRLDEPRPIGDFQGFIEVDFKNPDVSNITFQVTGKITPLIETKPFPAFFVATARDHVKEASIQIINHEAQPLAITGIECPSTRFALRLETNQLGQAYTLVLKLSGQGTIGRTNKLIRVRTSSQKEPLLLIDANTYVYERLHTFPEDIDFGTMDAAQVRTNITVRKTLTQILMVYDEAGSNLQVTAKADLPFLTTRVEPAANGKQVQIEVALKSDPLPMGDFQGHLELVTNDPEFPRMQINMKGQVR